MGYCVNCGKLYEGNPVICSDCYNDPLIIVRIIDDYLDMLRRLKLPNEYFNIIYPGERTSLAISISILLFIIFIATTVSFGIFFIIVLIGILNIRIMAIRNKNLFLKITQDNFPKMFNLIKLACYRLHIPLMPVYIFRDENYNAFTQGFFSDSWVILSSSLLEDFDPEEILFILGHELTHIKRRHTTWLTFMSPGSISQNSLISAVIKPIFNLWSIKCEYTADRGGLLVTRDLTVSTNTIRKLISGKNLFDNVNWEDILKKHENEENLFSKVSELFGTHPFPLNRIKELHGFFKSKKYCDATL